MAFDLVIGAQAPEGVPQRAPDEIALDSWNLPIEREVAEHFVGA